LSKSDYAGGKNLTSPILRTKHFTTKSIVFTRETKYWRNWWNYDNWYCW